MLINRLAVTAIIAFIDSILFKNVWRSKMDFTKFTSVLKAGYRQGVSKDRRVRPRYGIFRERRFSLVLIEESNMTLPGTLLLTLLLASPIATAEIYKCKDSRGNDKYQNFPCQID